MRNRFFYNNNQAQAKRVRKSLKQKWTKAVCIGTLSAAMITGVPVIPPISAYTQEVYAAVSENAKIYKLSDPSLVTTKTITDFYGNKTAVSYIDIEITEDGTYTITGSNKVDGKDIDVHISVGKGVKAILSWIIWKLKTRVYIKWIWQEPSGRIQERRYSHLWILKEP